MRLCVMPEMPMHLVQDLHIGTLGVLTMWIYMLCQAFCDWFVQVFKQTLLPVSLQSPRPPTKGALMMLQTLGERNDDDDNNYDGEEDSNNNTTPNNINKNKM